jgi:hypothetical protein
LEGKPLKKTKMKKGDNMSKTELQAPFTSFSGTIGKLVFRKVKGKTIVAVKPDPDRPLSEAEAAQRQDFAQAAAWAKAALQDVELRPFYQALGKQRNIPPRAAAMSDFLVRPTLEGLDLSEYDGQPGNKIYFKASDPAGLVSATVTITDPDGNPIESGAAVEVDDGTGYWMYDAQSALLEGATVLVKASVSDRPGNIVEASEEKILL